MLLAECLIDVPALLVYEKNKSLLERNFQSIREYMISFYNKWIFHKFSNIS